jgi:hypothetical protein
MSFIEPLQVGPNPPVAPPAIAGAWLASVRRFTASPEARARSEFCSWVVEGLAAAILI